MGEQPAADHRLGQPRAFFARRGGAEIAQPREALQLIGQGITGADTGEVEVGERQGHAADRKPAGEQRVAARTIALDVIARDRGQL